MKLNSAALSCACKVPGSIPKSREGDRGEGHKGKTGRERGGGGGREARAGGKGGKEGRKRWGTGEK